MAAQRNGLPAADYNKTTDSKTTFSAKWPPHPRAEGGPIDNGTVEQSNNAFYGREGKWLIENHGADPDYLVDNDLTSVVAGRDLQIEKAIEVILERIKANPLKFAPQPAYPKK